MAAAGMKKVVVNLCEYCDRTQRKKMFKALASLKGVLESVKVDLGTQKLIVIGYVDSTEVVNRARKVFKNAVLLSNDDYEKRTRSRIGSTLLKCLGVVACAGGQSATAWVGM